MVRFEVGVEASELARHYASVIKSQIILTTGVTPGSIGSAYVEAVAAASPSLLILAGRSQEKLDREVAIIQAAHPTVSARTIIVDLASFASVRAAAARINSWDDVPHIDTVMNSAGIMATPHALSPDGFEMQFAANHLGHFLLVNLVMDKILAAKKPRIVTISSGGHRFSPIRWSDINFQDGDTYQKFTAYGQSKTANMLMAISLAEKLGSRGLTSISLHPGIVTSGLANHLSISGPDAEDIIALKNAERRIGSASEINTSKVAFLSTSQGAATYIYGSFDQELEEHNGAYVIQLHIADPYTENVRPWANSLVEAELLWRKSEVWVDQKFSY